MTRERWHQIAEIYELAADQAPDRRDAFLVARCAGDEALRHDVESLLRQDDARLVLDRPALGAAAPLFKSDPDVKPGTMLGPYRIDAVLGAGGMGEVFRATDTRLDRVVAIKVLPSHIAADPQMRTRFAREARAISALTHPNICTLYDMGSQDGLDFLVMEYIEGESLAARLAGGIPPLRRALMHAIAIADALDHAHRRGIVHRDLKPANVMITAAGPKLLDFGLAAFRPPPSAALPHSRPDDDPAGPGANVETRPNRPGDGHDTTAGTLLGTIRYMAPEQLERRDVDNRTDVFAFGVMLFEMLTGRPASDDENAAGVRPAILTEEPLQSALLRAGVPQQVRDIVARCCARIPGDRWQTAGDLGRELTRAVTSLDGAHWPSRRLVRHGVALLALVCVSLAGWFMVQDQESSPAAPASPQIRSLAVLPLANLSGDPDQDFFADAMTEQLIEDLASLGGLRVISSGSVMPYRSAPKPIATVVRDLQVDAIVEGSVLSVGETIRTTVRLVRGANGEIVWARSYERTFADILALQNELARNITSELGFVLTEPLQGRLTTARTIDPEAYRQMLLGRFHAAKSTEAGLLTAIDYFDQAIARDQSYALAHAGLADVYLGLSGYYRDPREMMPKAKRAAEMALALDESLATAHATLGWIHLVYDWDGPAARTELLRALDLNPTLATARLHYAAYLTTQSRHDEAAGEIRRAFDVDPLSVRTNALGVSLLLFTRHYDEAIEMARKGLEFEPRSAFALAFQGVAFAEQGRLDDAVDNLTRAAALDSSPTILALQAHVLAISGRRDQARVLLRQLEALATTSYFCPYEIGAAHVSLGDADTAEQWFRKGVEGRADCMAWLGVEPWIESFRSDPRYSALLRDVGLDPAVLATAGRSSGHAR